MGKIEFKLRQRAKAKKNMTVGDIHVATALGNQEPKAKAQDFLTVLGSMPGGAKIVQLPPPAKVSMEAEAEALAETGIPVGEVGKKDGQTTVYFMRHGATKFNNQTDMSQDRVRSWNDVPLTEEGREDAHKAGKKLGKYGIKTIVSSNLGRAKETTRIVKKEIGDPSIKIINTPKMLPWNLGKFTGQTTDKAHDGIKHFIENPDEVVPDGESFNDFRKRAFEGMSDALKAAGGKPMLVVSHHRNERLWATSGKPPRPDAKIDAEKFLKPGEDPGDVTTFDFDARQLKGDVGDSTTDAEPESVGKMWGSNDEMPASIRNSLPDEAQTVFRNVANDRYDHGASEQSAMRQAWSAVKNGWKKQGDKWVRKSEGNMSAKGGPINASLILNQREGENVARSPFPYDQYFFANLRNDQKERLLSALTDPTALPIKVVRLSDLSAVQDRVDPEKVQSMVDNEPDTLPLVVRTGPGRIDIADGHHRLTAKLLQGYKTAPVHYMDVEAKDQRIHQDGEQGQENEPPVAGDTKKGWFKRWFTKAYSPDEARDAHGRWTSGGTADEHLSALRNAGTDQGQFTAAFQRLEHDKAIKNKDLEQIVRLYDHGVVLGSTRGDHLKQIRQAFVRNARFENKTARDAGFTREFEIKKVDEDQHLVFGWASIASIGGECVVDKQDDIIPEDELEKAAYNFVLYCRSQGDMHDRMGVGRCVESMMFSKQKQDALGIDLGLVGWWIGFKVDDEDVWKRIKDGDLPEFSIGGKATREIV